MHSLSQRSFKASHGTEDTEGRVSQTRLSLSLELFVEKPAFTYSILRYVRESYFQLRQLTFILVWD